MKTLEEIKEEIAKDNGYTHQAHFPSAWNHLLNAVEDDLEFDSHFNEVVKRYAIEAIKNDREQIVLKAHELCYTTENMDGTDQVHIGGKAIGNLPIQLL